MQNQDLIQDARALRHHLHDCAEVSFQEEKTARTLIAWLEKHQLELTSGVAGTGVVVRVRATKPGPTRLYRADIDAIGTTDDAHEVNLGFRLARDADGPDAEHVCGHDGHTAMLAGALATLARHPDAWSGEVVGVFQPAEEVGRGAAAMLEHEALRSLQVDAAYSVHNQPGMPLGTVGIANGVAALASTGLILRLTGEGTHASTPHKGNAAISAMATLVRELLALPSHVVPFGSSVLITPTYLDAGRRQFGRVPPAGELGVVVRGDSDESLDTILREARHRASALADAYGLRSTVEQVEPFPVTVNDHEVVMHVERTLGACGIPFELRDGAQPWSEDFGYFLQRWPGALMLLGAGEDHPTLHSPQYAFPDALLEPGIGLWLALAGWNAPASS